MENEEKILKKAEIILARRKRKEVEEEDKKHEERLRGYLFWCSEGCGLVDRNHRCEQWCSLTAIPPGAVKAIQKKGRE